MRLQKKFLKIQQEYCLEDWKFCKIILKKNGKHEKEIQGKNAKPVFLKNYFQKWFLKWPTFEIIAALIPIKREMLVGKIRTLKRTIKRIKSKIFRIWIQLFMDFIRSMDDFKRERKMCFVKIGSDIQSINRPGPWPQPQHFSDSFWSRHMTTICSLSSAETLRQTWPPLPKKIPPNLHLDSSTILSVICDDLLIQPQP